MKLNPDCIRAVLLATEEKTGYNIYFSYPEEAKGLPALNGYEDSEIRYHILQCAKSGLIEMKKVDLADNIAIVDLTPRGHSFLADIRSDTVWKKTKDISGKVGSYSLDVLSKVASAVLSEFIRSFLV